MDVASYAEACAADGLRGDYSACRPDFTVEQDYDAYGAEDHAVWRALFERQSQLASEMAHPSFLDGLRNLNVGDRIPDFDQVNAQLQKRTGWTLVGVPGLIPAEAFFEHLAGRRFPTTNWIRSADEFDYIVEPDLFHDFFGHVPLLSLPVFADFMQLYGATGQRAIAQGSVEPVTRLYWYTAEYGLIREADGPLKAYGAGLMSSAGELPHAVHGPGVRRRPAALADIVRTSYEIDKYQRVYFVLDSFEALFQALQSDDLDAVLSAAAKEPAVDPATR